MSSRLHWRAVRAVAVRDARYLLTDPVIMITLVVMPLIIAGFISPLFAVALEQEGFADATGAEQSVPGTAVMFSFFLVTFTGYAIYQEHGWNTWDRLRTSGLSGADLLIAKCIAPMGGLLLQQAVLFSFGWALYGLDVESPHLLLAVLVPFGSALMALALFLSVSLTSVHQIGAVGNLLSILLGGLGGALAPLELLPGWAQAVGLGTPSYWAVRGYRTVLLEEGSIADLWPSIAVLFGMCVVLAVLAVRRFDVAAEKIAWG